MSEEKIRVRNFIYYNTEFKKIILAGVNNGESRDILKSLCLMIAAIISEEPNDDKLNLLEGAIMEIKKEFKAIERSSGDVSPILY